MTPPDYIGGGPRSLSASRLVEVPAGATVTLTAIASKELAAAEMLELPAAPTAGAETVADGLQEWFEAGACDGFVLSATYVPGAYEEFVRLVVPELQRRGLHQKDYRARTLRQNLGLPGLKWPR